MLGMEWLDRIFRRPKKEELEGVEREKENVVYDWIEGTEVGEITEIIRDDHGDVKEYAVKHPKGNIINYPRQQVRLEEGKYYLAPYGIRNAFRLLEALKESSARAEELENLYQKKSISEELYNESIKQVFHARAKVFETFGTVLSDLEELDKTLTNELDKMLADLQRARSQTLLGEMDEKEFQVESYRIKERAVRVRARKGLIEELRKEISVRYTELGVQVEKRPPVERIEYRFRARERPKPEERPPPERPQPEERPTPEEKAPPERPKPEERPPPERPRRRKRLGKGLEALIPERT